MSETLKKAREINSLQSIVDEAQIAINRLGETAMAIGQRAASSEFKSAFAHATPFLNAMGDVIVAWMLVWRAQVAAVKLAEGAKKKDVAFYEGQIKSADFFVNTVLPVTLGNMNAIEKGCPAAVEIDEAAFGG
jgi:hypothetical protein